MKLEEHVEEFVKDFFLPDVCDSMVLEFECNEYSLREGLPELLTAYAKQEVERERGMRLPYMDFVDEMAVDIPFNIAFESLNKRLKALTPNTK